MKKLWDRIPERWKSTIGLNLTLFVLYDMIERQKWQNFDHIVRLGVILVMIVMFAWALYWPHSHPFKKLAGEENVQS